MAPPMTYSSILVGKDSFEPATSLTRTFPKSFKLNVGEQSGQLSLFRLGAAVRCSPTVPKSNKNPVLLRIVVNYLLKG